MYKIKNWFPDQTKDLHGAAYTITLTQKWFDAVAKTELTQENCDALIKNLGKNILLGHGYTHAAENPEYHLRMEWDKEIGPVIIQVPGNACTLGYDPTCQFGCASWEGEKILSCHNTDCLSQASIQLTMFLIIAEYLEMEEYERNENKRANSVIRDS